MNRISAIITIGITLIIYMIGAVCSVSERAQAAGQKLADAADTHVNRHGTYPKTVGEMGFKPLDGNANKTEVDEFVCTYTTKGDTAYAVRVIVDYETLLIYNSKTRQWDKVIIEE